MATHVGTTAEIRVSTFFASCPDARHYYGTIYMDGVKQFESGRCESREDAIATCRRAWSRRRRDVRLIAKHGVKHV